MKKYNFAIVGATGLVGKKLLEVLEQRKVPIKKLYCYASKKSAGTIINFDNQKITVLNLSEENIKDDINYAIFSAGANVSKIYAPLFAKKNITVIDNSSYWRMHNDIPLIVPEVNANILTKKDKIIANPNCSTIQSVVALNPLKKFDIKRIVYSTYQAVSGAGFQGYMDLKEGLKGKLPQKFPRPISFNVIPQIDIFLENGYSKEEDKMINETKKILQLPDIKVTATAVRVPVFYSHSISINVEFNKKITLKEILDCLKQAKGLVVFEKQEDYPTPLEYNNKDEVFVGRIRLDESVDNGINIFVVADNLRKGAATNAIQIAEYLINNNI